MTRGRDLRTTISAREPRVPALRAAWDPKRVRFIDGPHGEAIPVRCYGTSRRRRPVIICHGLQSHSGWFLQSTMHLAEHDHPAYAMDRMGSGLSSAPRGHCRSLTEWLDEIDMVLREAMRTHDHDDCFVLGHGFGAILATAYACRYPDRVSGLIAVTPVIHARVDLPIGTRLAIRWQRWTDPLRSYPLPMEARQISQDPDFIDFVQSDPLALRAATAGLYSAAVQARRFIHQQADELTVPVLVQLAGTDPLVDQERTRRLLQRAPAAMKEVRNYPDARHIIEFGPQRERFLGDLVDWLDRAERHLDGA
ncbi:MAG: alpha/beta fold hydrolase [Planctomycetota bacterium]